MKVIKSRDFTAPKAWGALDITNLNGTTVRLHWTDQPIIVIFMHHNVSAQIENRQC